MVLRFSWLRGGSKVQLVVMDIHGYTCGIVVAGTIWTKGTVGKGFAKILY